MEASDGETLGMRLRRLARARGWSDEDAAREVGVSYRQYQRWLAGGSDPRGSSLRRLADTFEVRIDELIPGTPNDSRLERIDGKLGEMVTRLEAIERRLAQPEGPDVPAAAVRAAVDVAGRLADTDESQTPQAPEQPATRRAGKRRKSA